MREPRFVAVITAEQIGFDDDAAFAGLRNKIFQAREILVIPFRQIEFVAAIEIARHVAARPRCDELFLLRCENIIGNAKCAGLLSIGEKCARQIELILGERVEVFDVIKFQIHDRAVMLARRNQNRRLVAKQKVMRVVGMQREWFGLSKRGDTDEQQHEHRAFFHNPHSPNGFV